MIIGILSDTHEDRANALPHVLKQFKERGVESIIHCGDIRAKHFKKEAFGDWPVVCVLTEDQIRGDESSLDHHVPEGWTITVPGNRITTVGNLRVYAGHKRSFEFLAGSEAALIKTLDQIRRDHDGVRWLFSGHTHHQIYKEGRLISFLNPGAVEDSFDGYEFAVINTETGEVVFGRIPKEAPLGEKFSIGVISDSLDVSRQAPSFWGKLVTEFKKRDVSNIIHCGNLSLSDIGREELKEFDVHYSLRPAQKKAATGQPKNWHLIVREKPIVKINGYYFYIQLELGADLIEKSESDMYGFCLKLRRRYPEISFVLCGLTNEAFLEEGQQVRIINPGDALRDGNFAVISLPVTEISFCKVVPEPLPNLV